MQKILLKRKGFLICNCERKEGGVKSVYSCPALPSPPSSCVPRGYGRTEIFSHAFLFFSPEPHCQAPSVPHSTTRNEGRGRADGPRKKRGVLVKDVWPAPGGWRGELLPGPKEKKSLLKSGWKLALFSRLGFGHCSLPGPRLPPPPSESEGPRLSRGKSKIGGRGEEKGKFFDVVLGSANECTFLAGNRPTQRFPAVFAFSSNFLRAKGGVKEVQWHPVP